MKKRTVIAAMALAASVMAMPAVAEEAATEANVETTVEVNDDEILFPEADFCGEWSYLGSDNELFQGIEGFTILPNTFEGEEYVLDDDNTITFDMPSESLEGTGVYSFSATVRQRTLTEQDFDRFGLTDSAKLVVDVTPVLEYTLYAEYESNPTATENYSVSSLYTYAGYTDDYIKTLLTANQWTLDGETVFFRFMPGMMNATMHHDLREAFGECAIEDGHLLITMNGETTTYKIGSIATDKENRGDLTLVEEGNEENTLFLAVDE